ncbi:hypothetical protein A9W94_28525 [Mycobacterium asiaticum]|nr:hypothetical protein A9W94_28525 [Mycobacterium asiaticum]
MAAAGPATPIYLPYEPPLDEEIQVAANGALTHAAIARQTFDAGTDVAAGCVAVSEECDQYSYGSVGELYSAEAFEVSDFVYPVAAHAPLRARMYAAAIAAVRSSRQP